MKTRLNQGLDPQLYYYRDSHQNEVDVTFKSANQLIPIEVKAAQTFNSYFLKSIHYYQNLVGGRAPHGYLIYTGDAEQQINQVNVLNYKNAKNALTSQDKV